MMLSPIEFSRPAPTWPASMMPLAAPVTHEPAELGHRPAKGDGLLKAGSCGRVRAEPKTVTLRRER